MFKIRFAAMFAVVVLAGLSLPASAQEIQKPAYVAGEWCEYRDMFGNTVRQTVTEIAPDGGFVMVWEGETYTKEIRKYNADHELTWLGERAYTPAWSGPKFPLKVGASGTLPPFSYELTGGVTTAKPVLEPIEAEVVKVPAGAFESLAVKVVVTYTRERGRSNDFLVTTWYALDPSIRWPVKRTFLDQGSRSNKANGEMAMVRCGR